MAEKTGKMAFMTGVDQPLEIREFPVTSPAAGMARLSLAASGVCGTDVHILRGKIPAALPMALGHEFVGRIEEMAQEDGKPYGLAVGDYAIVDIACPCGRCKLCREGDDANCLHMATTNSGSPEDAPHFHGGYGEYSYAPVKNLVKIPASLDPKMVCVYACAGPTAMHAIRLAAQANAHVERAEVAVVQGLGPVGTCAVMYLAAMGIPHVLAVGAHVSEERAALAKKLGASEVLDVAQAGFEAVCERVMAVSEGIGADVVFEASGNPSAVPQGMQMLRNRGVYLVPGQYSNSGNVEIAPQSITFKALHIIGSSQYSLEDVAEYLAFLETHRELHPTILELAAEYPVDKANEALADAKAGKNIKTMLVK